MSSAGRLRVAMLFTISIFAAACTGGGGEPDPVPVGDPLQGAWRAGFGLPGAAGAGAQVYAAVRGPDGDAYAGGIFEEVGTVPASNVAAFDGTAWRALGDGLPGSVNALVFDTAGNLWAGGWISDETTPNRIQVWDGTSWTAVPGDLDGTVRAVAVQGTSLLIAGEFSDAGGSGAAGIARYDGTAWSGIGTTGVTGSVKTIDVVDETTFCIAGSFDSVDGVAAANAACWDGMTWSQLGDGLPGEVDVLRRDANGTFHAGGTFAFIIDQNTGDYIASLGRLNGGTWEPLAGGVDGGFVNGVRAIHFEEDGDLVIGGTFGMVGKYYGEAAASHVARLSAGGTWSQVGGGVRNAVGVFLGSVEGVNTILPLEGGDLLLGGVFSHAGTTAASNLVRASGDAFSPVVPDLSALQGLSGLANALAVDADGGVIAGGFFAGAGDAQLQNVGRYANGAWAALGDGLNDNVRALLVRKDGTLVAGGDFTGSGNTEIAHLAVWNGTAWQQLGGGVLGTVFALAEGPDGALYVGGEFVTAGGVTANGIARWNGTGFEAFDGGIAADNVQGRVTTIAFDRRGRLLVGGVFDTAGGVPASGIARWSGSAWSALGGGFGGEYGGYASSIVVDGDDIYVAGGFDEVGGQAIAGLARFDGSQWHAVGDPLTSYGYPATIVTLVPYGEGFFITGTFEEAGTTSLRYVTWFDGTSYHTLAEGLSDLAEDILVHEGTLYVAGGFLRAGPRVSSGFAAWDFPLPTD